MKSCVAFTLVCSIVSIEAFRLPGLGHFRNTNEYPTFEVGKLFSSIRNFMKPNPDNESENLTSNEGKVKKNEILFLYEMFFTVITDKELSTENYVEQSPKAHFIKMLPNPEVGVPFIYAYDKFNKEIEKLEELQKEELSKDRDTSDLSRSKS